MAGTRSWKDERKDSCAAPISLGCRFATYASWWIQQTVTRAVAAQSRMIRLPMHVHNLLNKVRRIRRALRAETGQEPSEEQLAEILDMPSHRLRTVLRASKAAQVVVTREPLLGCESNLGEASDAAPEDVHYESRRKQQVLQLLNGLGETEAHYIALRYGLLDGLSRSPTQIAKGLGTEREQVNAVLAKAMKKLRQPQAIQEISSIYLGAQSNFARKVPEYTDGVSMEREIEEAKSQAQIYGVRQRDKSLFMPRRRGRKRREEREQAVEVSSLHMDSDLSIPGNVKARELGIRISDWQMIEGIDALAALTTEDAFLKKPTH
mmetsp:Transcript_15865/g.60438  ORF Transcript_15865/g.60438 Transcript_15865/m.60438 type:complete len:321 (+) Transcript_15865:779-1741(+)